MADIIIGGHRGYGETDRASIPPEEIATKPAENTYESVKRALDKGARIIEIDTVRTKDDVVAITHSADLFKHIFNPKDRKRLQANRYVHNYTYAELKQFSVGRKEQGIIPRLSDILSLITGYDTAVLNIEMKDVKGTGQPRLLSDRPVLAELIARDIKHSALPTDRIIISSFAESDLKEMKAALPEIALAQLFDGRKEGESPVYPEETGNPSRYLQFTPENIKRLHTSLGIAYVHPEIHSLSKTSFQTVSELGLGVNTWSLGEVPPEKDKAAVSRAISLKAQHSITHLGLITNFVPEMKEQVDKICQRSHNPHCR